MSAINLEKKELAAKLLLLGDGGVGKTTLRTRYMGKTPSSSYYMTLGADFSFKEFKYHDFNVRLHIWDIAGQPQFKSISGAFYQGADGALILFDVTNKTSLKNVKNWLDKVLQKNKTGREIPIVIIGNKIDTRKDSQDEITSQEGERFVNDLSKALNMPIPYFETSALTSEHNIAAAFNVVADFYIKKRETTQT